AVSITAAEARRIPVSFFIFGTLSTIERRGTRPGSGHDKTAVKRRPKDRLYRSRETGVELAPGARRCLRGMTAGLSHSGKSPVDDKVHLCKIAFILMNLCRSLHVAPIMDHQRSRCPRLLTRQP